MFSALNPGDTIYILYKNKSDKPILKLGEIINKTEPVPTYNAYGANYNDTKLNITVKIDDGQTELKNVSGNASIMSDPTTGIFVTETMDAMAAEVVNCQRASRKHVDDNPYHENALIEYDKMLKTLSPRYAQDKKRDEDIASLQKRQDAMDDKLDKILNAVMNK